MHTIDSPSRRPRRRPTIDEAAALETAIREAAVDTFLSRGYDATTMDSVARAAGITRRTLYARYANKEAMFADVVHEALRNPPDDHELQLDLDDLPGALLKIAQSAHARAIDERTIRLGLLLMSEAHRFPKLVPKEHHLIRLPHMRLLVELLTRHREAGTIQVHDLEIAAEQFLTMVASHPARLASFGLRRTGSTRDRYLAHAVDLFLHGIGNKGN
jgi:AcrR family transcriptional regulator